jgi:hypothetical protein
MEILIPIIFAILIDRQRESIMIGMKIEIRMKIE